ncbi:GNAT family N-acetyltransferase [Flavobacterium davisii]|uniref:GNAT family N-acetyltransferase n=1 Tax=Flavobacterium davisii TaxID=2906077 RepID=UPI001F366B86|nr:hypothetical protein [Flavobacterium davisii]
MMLQLESKKLIFKPFEMTDAQSLFEMDRNPNVHKYLWQQPIQDIEDVKIGIKKVLEQYEKIK